MVCLAGCKEEEDPQSVEFSIKEIRIDRKSHTIDVNITANCPWIIEDADDFVVTNIDFGDGDSRIAVTSWRNEDYEDREHTIKVRSEDGSSVDYLTVYQEANTGLQLERPKMIDAEGGTFQIKVKTNDNITSVETPDWITFTASRSLTDYIYTFTAQPNKTGSQRRGPVRLRGDKMTDYVNIDQDSYAPTRVKIADIPKYTSSKTSRFKIDFEPSYADLSKLSVECKGGCTAEVENDILTVGTKNYGKQTLAFYGGTGFLSEASFDYIPENVFSSDSSEVYIWQTSVLPMVHQSANYQIQPSDTTVIQSDGNGNAKAVGLGTAYAWASYKNEMPSGSHKVTVQPFVADAYLNWVMDTGNNPRKVRFIAKIRCHSSVSLSGYILVDKNNIAKLIQKNEDNPSVRTIITPEIEISYQMEDYKNIHEALKGYKFIIEMVVGGKVYQRWIEIDTNRLGS